MKIILILLAIWILYNKRNTLKSLFKSKESTIKEYEEVMDKLTKTVDDETTIKGLMFIVSILIILGYILFYILSAVFINSFVFTVISIIFIFNTLRTINVVLKILEKDYSKLINKFGSIINLITDISYIGYVLYQIFVRW
jgi:hypothetical protein